MQRAQRRPSHQDGARGACASRAGNAPPQAQPSELELGFTALRRRPANRPRSTTPESLARAADKLHEARHAFRCRGRRRGARRRQPTRWPACSTARDDWAAAVRATEVATDAYRVSGRRSGHSERRDAARRRGNRTRRRGMNAGTQRAEQRAMYASGRSAPRRGRRIFREPRDAGARRSTRSTCAACGALNVGDYDAADKVVLAGRRDGAGQQRRRRAGEVARAISPACTIAAASSRRPRRNTKRCCRSSIQSAALSIRGAARQLRLHLDRARRFRSRARAAHRGLELYTRASASEDERAVELAALGGLYFRMGDAERALETLRAAIVAQERSRTTASASPSTLRVAGNAASMLGQHDAGPRIPAQVRADRRESAQRCAHPRADRRRIARARQTRRRRDGTARSRSNQPIALVRARSARGTRASAARARITRAAIEDLRAADQQYAALGLEFNRIDTNTALSQALLGTRDVAGAIAAADEADRDRQPHPRQVRESGMARAFPVRAILALRGADRRGVRRAREDAGAPSWRAFRTAEDVRARSLADELASMPRRRRCAPSIPKDERCARGSPRSSCASNRACSARTPTKPARSRCVASIEETRAQIDAHRVAPGRSRGEADHAARVAAAGAAAPAARTRRCSPTSSATAATHAWLLTRSELAACGAAGPRARCSGPSTTASTELRAPVPRDPAHRKLGAMLLGHVARRRRRKAHAGARRRPAQRRAVRGAAAARADERAADRSFVLGYAPSLALAMARPRTAAARATRVSPWSPTRCTPPTIAGCSSPASGDGGTCAARCRPRPTISRGCRTRRSRRARSTKAFGARRHDPARPGSRRPPRACCSCRRANSRCCISRPTP